MKKLIIGTTATVVMMFCVLMIEPERKPNVVEKDPILKDLEEGKSSTEIYEEMMNEMLKENNDTI